MLGQPVFVSGNMGKYWFVCFGTEKAINETFGRTCHGVGRLQSRIKARFQGRGRGLFREMEEMGVFVKVKGFIQQIVYYI